MGLVLPASAFRRTDSVHALTDATKNFLSSLNSEQRARTVLRFGDENRSEWHYIPDRDFAQRLHHPRQGLLFREMAPYQKHLAHALLAAGLSQSGYIKATTVMSLEDVLRQLEGDDGQRRNPENYHFTVFGEPTAAGTWGVRVEGHHISLHFTIVNGKMVAAPTFFGANPAEVRIGPRAGLRVLAREEDLARQLLEAMTPDQKAATIVTPKAYGDILTEATRQAALKGQPSGLQVSKMDTRERGILTELIGQYIAQFPDDVADMRLEQVRKAGDDLFFAWAGVEARGGPHYYRVQSPAFLIEYDCTQDKANHIHSVWRDFANDWGRDLLKDHYQGGGH
jgi:hypothetical protein